jgi:hypothetical protein
MRQAGRWAVLAALFLALCSLSLWRYPEAWQRLARTVSVRGVVLSSGQAPVSDSRVRVSLCLGPAVPTALPTTRAAPPTVTALVTAVRSVYSTETAAASLPASSATAPLASITQQSESESAAPSVPPPATAPVADVLAGMGCPTGTHVVVAPAARGDGAGSQIFSFVTSYILSRVIGPRGAVGYLHRTITQLDLHGQMPDAIPKWNALIALPDIAAQGCVLPDHPLASAPNACVQARFDSAEHVTALRQPIRNACAGATTPINIVLSVDLTGMLGIDVHHAILGASLDARLSSVVPWVGDVPSRPTGPPELSVAVHVRRGDVLSDWGPGGPAEPHGRWTPNAYFVAMCNALSRALRDSGLPAARYTIYMDNVTDSYEFHKLALGDFDAISAPHRIVLGGDPVSAFASMVHSDILFAVFSQLSISAGLLRDIDRGVVICWPWTALNRPEWFIVDTQAPMAEATYYPLLMSFLADPENKARLQRALAGVRSSHTSSPLPPLPSATATMTPTHIPASLSPASTPTRGPFDSRLVTPATEIAMRESSGCSTQPHASLLQVLRPPSWEASASLQGVVGACTAQSMLDAIGRGSRATTDAAFVVPQANTDDVCVGHALHWFTAEEACDLLQEHVGFLYMSGDSLTRHLTQALWSILAGNLSITNAVVWRDTTTEGRHPCLCEAAFDDGHEIVNGEATYMQPRNRYCREHSIAIMFGAGVNIDAMRSLHGRPVCPRWQRSHLCFDCDINSGLPARGVLYSAGGLHYPELDQRVIAEVFQAVPGSSQVLASWPHVCGLLHSPEESKKPIYYLTTHGRNATLGFNALIRRTACQRPGDAFFDAFSPTVNATSIDGQHYYQPTNMLLAQLLLNTLATM